MHSPDDIAAEWPPPRDDEPASLRRDIIDELADHLACALERERQREGAVPSLAGTSPWQRVLDRFGSPPAIALQLWRLAMQENFIVQRLVLLAAIFVMGATCFGMYFIVRTLTAQNQAILAQQREMAETLRRVNEQARSAPAPRTETSVEWVPVEVQLRSAEPGTSLPPGYLVYLARQQDTTGTPPWEVRTDDTPFVKFPLVRYGRYTFKVEAPWGEYLTREININPGAAVHLTVDCPPRPPQPLVVQPRFVVPEEFRDRKLFAAFHLGAGERPAAGIAWTTLFQYRGSIGNGSSVLIGTDGAVAARHGPRSLEPFRVRDAAGKDLGLRWPDEAIRPGGSVHIAIEKVVDARQASGGAVPIDANDGPYKVPYVFELKTPFLVGRHVSFLFQGDGKPMHIELTEAGAEELREALRQFDSLDDYTATAPNQFVDVLKTKPLEFITNGSPTPASPAESSPTPTESQ